MSKCRHVFGAQKGILISQDTAVHWETGRRLETLFSFFCLAYRKLDLAVFIQLLQDIIPGLLVAFHVKSIKPAVYLIFPF